MHLSVPNLLKVGKTYYFRMQVPKDLRGDLEVRELKKSLETSDLQTATTLANLLTHKFKQLFRQHRDSPMEAEKLRSIAYDYLNNYLDGLKRKVGTTRYSSQRKADEIALLNADKLELDTAAEENNISTIRGFVDAMLASSSVEIEPDSGDYIDLCNRAMKWLYRIIDANIRMLEKNDYSVSVEEIMGDDLPSPISPQAVEVQPSPTTIPANCRLKWVAEEFIKAKYNSGDWTKGTRLKYQEILDLLVGSFGADYDIRLIDKSSIRTYRDEVLRKIPVHRTKKTEFKEQSLHQLIKRTDFQTRSLTTVEGEIRCLSTFFNWAIEEAVIERNPAKKEGKLRREGRPDKEKRPFSSSELKKFLTILSELPENKHFGHRYWIPLICLFSGARLNEVCQLYVHDLEKKSGIWCFNFNEVTQDKSIKTAWGERTIPVHPMLLRLGLIEYWEKIKDADNERLFPRLTHSEEKGYKRKLSSFYTCKDGVIRKRITKDPKKSLHSLRHNFINNLNQNQADIYTIKCIAGHKRGEGETELRYSDPAVIKRMVKAMEKLDYGIDVIQLLSGQQPKSVPVKESAVVTNSAPVAVAETPETSVASAPAPNTAAAIANDLHEFDQ